MSRLNKNKGYPIEQILKTQGYVEAGNRNENVEKRYQKLILKSNTHEFN